MIKVCNIDYGWCPLYHEHSESKCRRITVGNDTSGYIHNCEHRKRIRKFAKASRYGNLGTTWTRDAANAITISKRERPVVHEPTGPKLRSIRDIRGEL